jgi:spore coat protein JC
VALGYLKGETGDMWIYEKRLQYPVKIKITDPHLAQIIIAQYGGPNIKL